MIRWPHSQRSQFSVSQGGVLTWARTGTRAPTPRLTSSRLRGIADDAKIKPMDVVVMKARALCRACLRPVWPPANGACATERRLRLHADVCGYARARLYKRCKPDGPESSRSSFHYSTPPQRGVRDVPIAYTVLMVPSRRRPPQRRAPSLCRKRACGPMK